MAQRDLAVGYPRPDSTFAGRAFPGRIRPGRQPGRRRHAADARRGRAGVCRRPGRRHLHVRGHDLHLKGFRRQRCGVLGDRQGLGPVPEPFRTGEHVQSQGGHGGHPRVVAVHRAGRQQLQHPLLPVLDLGHAQSQTGPKRAQ